MKPLDAEPSSEKAKKRTGKRRSTILGQRLEEWSRAAKFRQGERVSRIDLSEPFKEVFDRNVFPAASEGRYLGNGHILISDTTQLIPWITNQSPQT